MLKSCDAPINLNKVLHLRNNEAVRQTIVGISTMMMNLCFGGFTTFIIPLATGLQSIHRSGLFPNLWWYATAHNGWTLSALEMELDHRTFQWRTNNQDFGFETLLYYIQLALNNYDEIKVSNPFDLKEIQNIGAIVDSFTIWNIYTLSWEGDIERQPRKNSIKLDESMNQSTKDGSDNEQQDIDVDMTTLSNNESSHTQSDQETNNESANHSLAKNNDDKVMDKSPNAATQIRIPKFGQESSLMLNDRSDSKVIKKRKIGKNKSSDTTVIEKSPVKDKP